MKQDKKKNITWEQLIREVILLHNENEKKKKNAEKIEQKPKKELKREPPKEPEKELKKDPPKEPEKELRKDPEKKVPEVLKESEIKPKNIKEPASCMHVESKMIPLCTSSLTPQNFIKNPIVSKLPVILSQFEVQIDCESDLKFNKPALDIIDIKSNIYISEYTLILAANKLFISGYIRESIQYTNLSKKLKHITVKVPFQCVTKVTFINSPVNNKPKPATKYNLTNCLDNDTNDLFFSNHYYIDEKIYCELVSSEVVQLVSKKDTFAPEKNKDISAFQRIQKNASITLEIRLFQNQLVGVNFLGNTE